MEHICIIGAGIAGITAMQEIKHLRPEWAVTVLSDEDRLPYKRTKISKHIASGFGKDDFALLPAEWYGEHDIDLRLGARVTGIDGHRGNVTKQDGSSIAWDRLLLAPGTEAREPDMPGFMNGECYTIRRASDVERILAERGKSRSVLVIGLGVLGVEVSEQLRAKGLKVTAISSDTCIMPKELNRAAQASLLETFEQQGIAVEFDTKIGAMEKGLRGGVVAVSQDLEYPADFAVFAIGSSYGSMWSELVETDSRGGIIVDENLSASLKNVFAAGDAVTLTNGVVSHLWHEAEAQGRCAGRNICGERVRYSQDRHRLKCEVFGRYFFSVGKPDYEYEHLYRISESVNGAYRCFYYRDDALRGVVMTDDKPRAKRYEQAVREGWDESRVTGELAF